MILTVFINAIIGGIIYYIHFINTTEKNKTYAKVNSVLIAVFVYFFIWNFIAYFDMSLSF